MKYVLAACGIVSVIFLTGCASIISKSEYPVSFSSDPQGATVTIVNRSGQTLYSGTTPTTVVLDAGAGFWKGEDYTATFESPGYGTMRAQVRRGVDGWYLGGNFIFGGLIGWLIVDPATGAMWTLEKNVHVSLAKQTSSIENAGCLNIVSVDQVPPHLRRHMVRIN